MVARPKGGKAIYNMHCERWACIYDHEKFNINLYDGW